MLVEGDIDREYLLYARTTFGAKSGLDEDIEIASYGGKDALKNTAMVRFVTSKMSRYFITYDLDADSDARKSLEKLGLVEGKNFAAIGINKPGHKAIEGLLPPKVIQAVTSRETDLVLALTSANTDEKNHARSQFKKKLLEEFRSGSYSSSEAEPLLAVTRKIGHALK